MSNRSVWAVPPTGRTGKAFGSIHDYEDFKEGVPLYNNTLRDREFEDNVEYAESRKAKKSDPKRIHARRITLFNPP